jgi:hypothetical protein
LGQEVAFLISATSRWDLGLRESNEWAGELKGERRIKSAPVVMEFSDETRIGAMVSV